jgi:hypothetical protein
LKYIMADGIVQGWTTERDLKRISMIRGWRKQCKVVGGKTKGLRDYGQFNIPGMKVSCIWYVIIPLLPVDARLKPG